MSKEKRLGRGLEALLGRIPTAPESTSARPAAASPGADNPYGLSVPLYEPTARPAVRDLEPVAAAETMPPPAAAAEQPAAVPGPLRLPVDQIDSSPYQPRQDFAESEIQALAESLATHGLLQPVVVRRLGQRYQLVAGERRLRAAAKAGWKDVPAQVIEADDRQAAELAIVENMQRKDLSPLEKAACFQRYLQQYQCTQEELAGRLKLDRSTIANLIRLLELPQTVQDSLRQGRLTQGHARALLPLGDEREQIAFSRRIQREGLSVRQTEALVQEAIAQADAEPLAAPGPDEPPVPARTPKNHHLAALEQEFRAALGVKVAIRQNRGGRGRLVVQFRSHEEFDRLRDHICGRPRPEAKAG